MLESIQAMLTTWQGIVGLTLSLTAAGWKCFKFMRENVVQPITAHITKVNQLVDVLPEVKRLCLEFKPNGGSSVKDQLNRIEAMSKIYLRITDKAFWVADLEGKYTEVSPALAMLMGSTPDQILGSGWVNSIHAPDRDRVEGEWLAAVHDQREFHMEFSYVQLATGSLLPVTCHSIPIRYEGKTVGHVGWALPKPTI